MKTRIFQTRFYDDDFIVDSDLYTQHLYLYLLTCSYINICGMFQLADAKIRFEAKLTETQLERAKSRLVATKKVLFRDGWVYVVNSRKNNNYEKSEKNVIACDNELSKVPDEIKSYFTGVIDSTIHTTMDSSQKPKTKNQKEEGECEGEKNYTLSDLTDELCGEIAAGKKVSKTAVTDLRDDLKLYCQSTGKKYKDYKAALLQWLSRAMKKGEVAKIREDDTRDALRTYNEINGAGRARLQQIKEKEKWST